MKHNRDIDVFSIPSAGNDEKIELTETIETSGVLADSLNHAEVSHCGQYLVCSGLCGNIGVWKLQTQRKKSQWKHLLNLPKHKVAPTALAIHRNAPKVVVAFADSKVLYLINTINCYCWLFEYFIVSFQLYEYDLSETKITYTTNTPFVQSQATHIISNIVLDPRNEDIFILQNDSHMFVVKKQAVRMSTGFIFIEQKQLFVGLSFSL